MTSRNSLFIAGISYFRSTIVIAINYYNMINFWYNTIMFTFVSSFDFKEHQEYW